MEGGPRAAHRHYSLAAAAAATAASSATLPAPAPPAPPTRGLFPAHQGFSHPGLGGPCYRRRRRGGKLVISLSLFLDEIGVDDTKMIRYVSVSWATCVALVCLPGGDVCFVSLVKKFFFFLCYRLLVLGARIVLAWRSVVPLQLFVFCDLP